ncbi:ABC transporter permease [Planctomycetota bacterium]|nr:ABC transporter permease [Planctomycetota bacterium]
MSSAPAKQLTDEEIEKGVSAWAVAWRQFKRDRVAVFALCSIIGLGGVALFSPLLANSKPIVCSYQDELHWPAFQDYLDENFPIPFGLPGYMRKFDWWSPKYPEIERPQWQTFPDWNVICEDIDGGADGWYLRPPVPFGYKETSPAYKTLPGSSLGRVEILAGPGEGETLDLAPKQEWKSTWSQLALRDSSLDEAVPATGIAYIQSEGWVTANFEAPGTKLTNLKGGEELELGGLSVRFTRGPTHVMGTDDVGRDVMSRLIHGTVIAGSVGFVSVAIYVFIGIIIGALAGYFRGWVDLLISRIIEIVICFPVFFLIIMIVGLWEPSIYVIMVALGLIRWTGVARLIRGEFLKIMSSDYVHAARALGFSDARVIFRHILPNAVAPVFVSASFGVAGAILVESSLSFLGFGVAPPTASWGEILRQGQTYINENLWHLVFAPGFCIFFTVTMFNLVGEGLRDALDPKLRQ